MDPITLPIFTGKIFDFWVVKMQTFLLYKELIEYQSNNPYDEVCDALVLDFIK